MRAYMPTTDYTEFLHNVKKNILNCNMKLNSIQIYNLINFFKKDLQGGVNVNIRMYNFDDVQCTVIPSVAYGFVTGMNLQLC